MGLFIKGFEESWSLSFQYGEPTAPYPPRELIETDPEEWSRLSSIAIQQDDRDWVSIDGRLAGTYDRHLPHDELVEELRNRLDVEEHISDGLHMFLPC